MKKTKFLFVMCSLFALAACGGGESLASSQASASSSKETDEYVEGKCYDDTDLEEVTFDDDHPYVAKNNAVYYGEFPQTIKKDSVTIDETEHKELKSGDKTLYDCYKGSDGYWYAKCTTTPYLPSGYTYSNGVKFGSGETAYFKVLPIKWNILTKDYNKDGAEDDWFIQTDRALAPCEYMKEEHYDLETGLITKEGVPSGHYANEWEYSDIRTYLNEDFCDIALSDAQKNLLKTVTLKNDKTQSDGASKASNTFHDANDTQDKIFLLSFAEVTNPDYGFDTRKSFGDGERQKYNTDLARAMGNDHWGFDDYFDGMSIWWLRSQYQNSTDQVERCSSHGYAYFYDFAYKLDGGIAPGVVLNIK